MRFAQGFGRQAAGIKTAKIGRAEVRKSGQEENQSSIQSELHHFIAS